MSGLPRPPLLRALGRNDPPEVVRIGGGVYRRAEIFKHDSWAATARYRGGQGDVVCKFNRVQSIFGLPMGWLGRWLAHRESLALRRLAGLQGIPLVLEPRSAEGLLLPNAVGHPYIAGHPLSSGERPRDEFFTDLERLLRAVHARDVAYIDLHKRENILVDEAGRPWLIDFQVCFGLWSPRLARIPALRSLLHALQAADWYHLLKHVKRHRPDQLGQIEAARATGRPWWIRVHRLFAVPFRTLRRGLLTALGVRGRGGRAVTEVFPEEAVRRERERAA
jgi:hypothetical protein